VVQPDRNRLTPEVRAAIAGRVRDRLQGRAVWVSDGAGHRVGASSLDAAVQIGARDRAGFQRRRRFQRSYWEGVRTHAGERLRFMTLPFPGGTRQDLRQRLGDLVAKVRREFGPFEYKAVYEVGAVSAVGHLHVVYFGPFIGQGWLSDTWEGMTGFGVVDIRAADGQLVRYMVKTLVGYLSKGDEGGGHCMQSRGWAVVPLPDLHERVLTELGRARVHLG
jgi:hypothetical protein